MHTPFDAAASIPQMMSQVSPGLVGAHCGVKVREKEAVTCDKVTCHCWFSDSNMMVTWDHTTSLNLHINQKVGDLETLECLSVCPSIWPSLPIHSSVFWLLSWIFGKYTIYLVKQTWFGCKFMPKANALQLLTVTWTKVIRICSSVISSVALSEVISLLWWPIKAFVTNHPNHSPNYTLPWVHPAPT